MMSAEKAPLPDEVGGGRNRAAEGEVREGLVYRSQLSWQRWPPPAASADASSATSPKLRLGEVT